MIARLICLFAGHEFTTIAWFRHSKEWSEKACLRCDKRKRNGHVPPRPIPVRLRRVK